MLTLCNKTIKKNPLAIDQTIISFLARANVLTSEPSPSPKERLRMGLKAASSLVQGPLTLFSLYHMLTWCFLWNMILSLCVLQCFCGGEAAVYAHASRQAAGYKNRSAVHKQSQVRCRHLMIQHICFHTFHYPIRLLVQWKLRHFVQYFTDNNVFPNFFQVAGEVSWTELSAEN